MSNKFKINAKPNNITLQTIIDRISLGYELQEKEDEVLLKEDIVKYNDAIIIAPDYQREYRSTVADESSLIESVLLGIPIPPVFLASHKYKGVQVLNVVDGQHRLRAFYRYFKGDFKLKELKILDDHIDNYFTDLDIDDINNLQSGDIATITFREFPGKDFELEIFNRYNKGTKPLTPQEIRHAVYDSRVNTMVNNFCKELLSDSKSSLSKAYAISKDRYQKKSCQETVFVILYILENGIDLGIPKSPQYAEKYMKDKSTLEKSTDDVVNQQYGITDELFSKFNTFINNITTVVEFPFSREIYGIAKRGNKFQVSISMILAGIFKKLNDASFDFSCLNQKSYARALCDEISILLNNSYLEDPEYKASTTNPVELEKVVMDFNVDIELQPKEAQLDISKMF